MLTITINNSHYNYKYKKLDNLHYIHHYYCNFDTTVIIIWWLCAISKIFIHFLVYFNIIFENKKKYSNNNHYYCLAPLTHTHTHIWLTDWLTDFDQVPDMNDHLNTSTHTHTQNWKNWNELKYQSPESRNKKFTEWTSRRKKK